MDKNLILNIKAKNYNLNSFDAKKIEEAVSKYPYFKFGHFLLLKYKFDNKSDDFNDYLLKTAVFADNRSFLYDFLHSKTLTNPSQPIKNTRQPANKEQQTKQTQTLSDAAEKKAQPTTNTKQRKKTKEELQKEIDEALKEVAKSTKKSATETSKKEEYKKTEKELSVKRIQKEDEASVDKFNTTWVSEEKLASDKTLGDKDKTSEFNKEKVIDKFLKENPKINKPGDENYSETERQAKESLKNNLGFVSETLAEIYAKQGNKKMAKQIYKQLMLKNTEKKLYFAGRIKKLDNNK